jgi:transposase
MFIRPCIRNKNGKRHAYWALVESVRTASGPRQRTLAYIGAADEKTREGVRNAANGRSDGRQKKLFGDVKPNWVEVDTSRVRVERCREFGGPWLGLELLRMIGLDTFFREAIPSGREEIPWPQMAAVLALCRLCEPSSELHIAEDFYRTSALPDLLGIPAGKINDDRLYRALDRLLPHKAKLEVFLKERLGELFDLKYDILMYDVTSTYFEGEAKANPQARRGYSRDHRRDCKQVCIALVVSRCGMPLGYEIFDGNRTDVTTVEEIVGTMEARYGRADRIWVMDRGMVSTDNIAFLKQNGRRYIVGTPKSMLKRFERELLAEDWSSIRDGLEVKLCSAPDGEETFVLCRSADRREKEKAMHVRFEKRIEEGLTKIEAACRKKKHKIATIAKRVGKLMGRNSRSAGLFETDIVEGCDGRAKLVWKKIDAWRDWAAISEGCYLLRTNVNDWTADDLWQTYIQLTQAEAAFRIHKSDLAIRPIWHQRQDRVQAHILVCFLAYVLWKTLAQLCHRAGLGDEPRRVLDAIKKIRLVDVVLPTRGGINIRKRCVTRPDEHQQILLQKLGLKLPEQLKMNDM